MKKGGKMKEKLPVQAGTQVFTSRLYIKVSIVPSGKSTPKAFTT